MAIVKKRTAYHLVLRLDGRQVWVSSGTDSKVRAREIERQVRVACQSRDFRFLDAEARCVTIALFRNREWAIPADLRAEEPLTLGKAVEMCLAAPENQARRARLKTILGRVKQHFGESLPISSLWIPQIREYLHTRQAAGAAPSTLNKEKVAISAMFRVLAEARVVQVNPALMIPCISEKSGQREAYVSHSDFQRVLEALPSWLRPIAQTAYYTGMRRGEILGLTRDRVSLSRRIITLRADDTKEGHGKRVPIHQELVPILEGVLKIQALGVADVFLRDGRPITEQINRYWSRALAKVKGVENLRFHDLRHTWRANARRSGVQDSIAEAILGHADRKVPINRLYGAMDEAELLTAIDLIHFGNGETVVWGAKKRQSEAS